MRKTTAVTLVVCLALAVVGLAYWGMAGLAKTRGQVYVGAKKAAAAPAPKPAPMSVDVPILVYHNIVTALPPHLKPADAFYYVTQDGLRRELRYLQEQGYEPTTFAALAAHFKDGAPLPQKPVIVSFDDGRISQWQLAKPVLDELNFKATFFIFTNAPDRNANYFTWDEIRALDKAGYEIGSHTRLHQYLTKQDNVHLESELAGSQADFKKQLGHPVAAIAYPFGLEDERVRAATSAAGYVAARALHHELAVSGDRLLDLPGYLANDDFERFKAVLAGKFINR